MQRRMNLEISKGGNRGSTGLRRKIHLLIRTKHEIKIREKDTDRRSGKKTRNRREAYRYTRKIAGPRKFMEMRTTGQGGVEN